MDKDKEPSTTSLIKNIRDATSQRPLLDNSHEYANNAPSQTPLSRTEPFGI